MEKFLFGVWGVGLRGGDRHCECGGCGGVVEVLRWEDVGRHGTFAVGRARRLRLHHHYCTITAKLRGTHQSWWPS